MSNHDDEFPRSEESDEQEHSDRDMDGGGFEKRDSEDVDDKSETSEEPSGGKTEKMRAATERTGSSETEMGLGFQEPEQRQRDGKQKQQAAERGASTSDQSPTVTRIIEVAEDIYNQSTGFLLHVWGIILAIRVITASVTGVIVFVTGAESNEGVVAGIGGLMSSTIALLTSFIVLTLVSALFVVVRQVMLEGKSFEFDGALSIIMERAPSALKVSLAFTVAVSVGIFMCLLPGLVALVLLPPSLYLVTARKMSVIEGFKKSANQVIENPIAFLTVYGVPFVAGLMLGAATVMPRLIFGESILLVPVQVVAEVISVGISFLAYLGFTGLCLLLESQETGRSLAKP
jgi:hypothetical protein